MTAPHLELGRRGEDEAAVLLSRRGFRILGRNIRNRCGEIDILAMDGDELVVVEVRVRSIGEIMSPEDSVGPNKIRKIVRAGSLLVESRNWQGPWRIDLVAMTVDRKGEWNVEHFRDITDGAWRP